MFYCDFPFGSQPQYMHNSLSSCVLRDTARAFNSTRATAPAPWSTTDLIHLLSLGPPLTILELLNSMCTCKLGDPVPSMRDSMAFAGEFALEGEVLVIEAGG
jgi:hypothetical protein